MKLLFSKKVRFVILVAVIVVLAWWLFTLEFEGKTRQFVTNYGYVGFFALSFIGGINVIFPLPHLIFIPPLLKVGLSPLVLGVIAALGTTLADSLGYLLGKIGGEAFAQELRGFQRWAKSVFQRYPRFMPIALFVWSATIPFPNEILVIPAGISGYGLKRILTIVGLGNLTFNIAVIYLGNVFLNVP